MANNMSYETRDQLEDIDKKFCVNIEEFVDSHNAKYDITDSIEIHSYVVDMVICYKKYKDLPVPILELGNPEVYI